MTTEDAKPGVADSPDAASLKREFPEWGVFEASGHWFAYRLLPLTAEQRACGARPEVTAPTAASLRDELLTEAGSSDGCARRTSPEANGAHAEIDVSGITSATLTGMARAREVARAAPPLDVQVGRPLDATPCDGLSCSFPAAVSVTLRAEWAPHFLCAEHWPAMRTMLRERGHKLTY